MKLARLFPDQVITQSNFMFSASSLMESNSTEDRQRSPKLGKITCTVTKVDDKGLMESDWKDNHEYLDDLSYDGAMTKTEETPICMGLLQAGFESTVNDSDLEIGVK